VLPGIDLQRACGGGILADRHTGETKYMPMYVDLCRKWLVLVSGLRGSDFSKGYTFLYIPLHFYTKLYAADWPKGHNSRRVAGLLALNVLPGNPIKRKQ